MWQLVATAVSHASFTDWLLLVFGLLLILYIVGTWNYDYFQKRGIPSSKPKIPFLGDILDSFIAMGSVYNQTKNQYKKGDGHGIYGLFEFTKPFFMIRDAEVLKIIAVKEFDNFVNRRSFENEPTFSKNLANLQDQHWRVMRTSLSPAFTTSKIKGMVSLISECGDQMVKHLQQEYEASNEGKLKQPLPTDMKDLFTRFANDVIATAAFGVACDSHNQPENEFYLMGKNLTTFTKLQAFLLFVNSTFPKFMKIFRLQLIDGKALKFFDSLVHETIREREKKGIFRPDLMHLLMQARDGKLKTEEVDKAETEEVGADKKKLTEEEILAQVLVFFFAGFETPATSLCLISHLLSHHPEVQKRLHAEIEKELAKTDGQIIYENIQGMKYLDAVVNEALRIYPPAPIAERICREDIQLPATETTGIFTVKKGQLINIPIVGFHYNPKYWENPEEFNPDRFSDENKHKIKPFTYIPFGVGPRICIGQRLALIEVKIALVHLLLNFELLPSTKTKNPLEFGPGLNLIPSEGFWCELKPRDK